MISQTNRFLKIDIHWVISTLPKRIIVGIAVFAFLGSFEKIINGLKYGGLTSLITTHNRNFLQYLSIIVVFYIVDYTGAFIYNYINAIAVYYCNKQIKSTLLANSLSNTGIHSDPASELSKLTSISKQIELQYFDQLGLAFRAATSLIVTVVFVINTQWLLGIIYMSCSLLTFLPAKLLKTKTDNFSKQWDTDNSKYVEKIKDIIDGKTQISNLHATSNVLKQSNLYLSTAEKSYAAISKRAYFTQYLSWLISVTASVLPLAIGLLLLHYNVTGITITKIITLATSAGGISSYARAISTCQSTISSTSYLRKLPLPYSGDLYNPLSTTLPEGQVTINDVSFEYTKQPVLDHASYTFSPQKKYIISAPSGTGKTTLIKLLTGALRPNSGSIQVGTASTSSMNIGLVAQNPWIFSGTIRDNLTLFQQYSDKQLTDVLKNVNLNNEIPNVLDYDCGPSGKNLSGGQKQRLVIARILLRNTGVLFLDEITSALDNMNATQIRTIIYNLPVTVIEVSHQQNATLNKQYNVHSLTLHNHKIVEV